MRQNLLIRGLIGSFVADVVDSSAARLHHADEEHADEDHADEDHTDEDHTDEDHTDERSEIPADDGHGHGTVMAGLVARRTGGVAPAARLVDVDVADDTGLTSRHAVIDGLRWIAEHGRSDGLDIRVE